MEDPLISLYSLIKDNWSVSDTDLDTIGGTDKEVLLTTGWFDADFQGPQISITQLMETVESADIGYNSIYITGQYQLDVWVPILRESSRGAGVAKKWRWTIREEIIRILKANLTDVGDTKYVVLKGSIRNLREVLPKERAIIDVLRTSFIVRVEFEA